jgi:hypothetical protein
MTAGLKVVGMLGGGAILASVVASEPSNTQPAQYVPTPATQERTVTPSRPFLTPITAPTPTPAPSASNCHPSYSGCLKRNAGDYDCAGGSGNGPNYTGQVRVYGSDPFGLDRDNDGWGCE